jgi:hypothetical protein
LASTEWVVKTTNWKRLTWEISLLACLVKRNIFVSICFSFLFTDDLDTTVQTPKTMVRELSRKSVNCLQGSRNRLDDLQGGVMGVRMYRRCHHSVICSSYCGIIMEFHSFISHSVKQVPGVSR